MEVKILGAGCAKCKKLYEAAQAGAAAGSIECQIEKVEDINEIMGYGVMLTPALVIDGEVKLAGKVPSVAEMTALLQEA